MERPIDTARRMARYGRRDWLVWKDRDGQERAEKASRDAFKAAMLATGTKGRFYLVEKNTSHLMNVTWPLAVLMRRNWRHIHAA